VATDAATATMRPTFASRVELIIVNECNGRVEIILILDLAVNQERVYVDVDILGLGKAKQCSECIVIPCKRSSQGKHGQCETTVGLLLSFFPSVNGGFLENEEEAGSDTRRIDADADADTDSRQA
jgi:hypothetical protein